MFVQSVISMKVVFCLGVVMTLVGSCVCQSSTIALKVVEIRSVDTYTFVCDLSPLNTRTRWTYMHGTTQTSLMSYQNGICIVSPSDSFLSDSRRFSYSCNKTVHQVTTNYSTDVSLNNHIVGCRDELKPDEAGSTWIIKILIDGGQCYCDKTLTLNVKEVKEIDDVVFICKESSDVNYVNWNKLGSNTAAMGVQNGQCTTSPRESFLNNAVEYIYTCNETVYELTRLNVQRIEHNDIYMCTPTNKLDGKGSNWIIKVKDESVNGYEIVDVNTESKKRSNMKKPPQGKATTNESKMSNINQDGLNYADLVFNGSQPVEKKEMKVYEPTPYDLVDFTKKAEPLTDSDDDENK